MKSISECHDIYGGKDAHPNDEELPLEKSGCEYLYGAQLLTQLIKPNFHVLLPNRRSSTVSLETNPLF